GFTRKDDELPTRVFEGLPDGPAAGRHVDRREFEAARDLYYGFAGWDPKTGNPTPEKLKSLSLGWLVEP
ncbi:MAG TPA: aldehyde ferredoxin oxidoreductase C-terminal domain-containing protein, partial [Bacillota bacterium]